MKRTSVTLNDGTTYHYVPRVEIDKQTYYLVWDADRKLWRLPK